MNQYSSDRNEEILKKLIAEAGISDLREFGRVAGVSQLQLIRLSRGLIAKMQLETLLKIARALNLSLDGLLSSFLPEYLVSQAAQNEEVENLKQEYQRLEAEIEQQKEELELKFQQDSIQKLESWLLQWPVASAAAKNNSHLSASKILPLVKPVEKLIAAWGVETIGSVGQETAYDPQWHQLMEGTANSGDLIRIRYSGYRHHNKLLYRAKVSPVKTEKTLD